MNSGQIIMVSVIGVYMAGMLAIGWWSSRNIKGLADFLVAGRKLGMVLATAAMLAAWIGIACSIGTAGIVYKQGLSGAIPNPLAVGLALILSGLFYAAAFRRLKLLTVLDLFGGRYSRGAEIFAALLMIPVYIGWLGSQILAIGLILSVLTNLNPAAGMILGALVVTISVCAGGMRAVAIAGAVQIVILVIGFLLIAPFAIAKVGGFAGLAAQTPPGFFRVLPAMPVYPEWAAYLGKWLIMGLGCVVGQNLIQRSLSSRDESVARRSAVWAGVIYLTIGMLVIYVGLCGRILFPGLQNAEQIMPATAKLFLNPFLLAVFVTGLLAAIMSLANSSLLAATSLFIDNITQRIHPHLSETHLLSISRAATVITMILSVVLALYVGQVYNLMVNSWATLLVSIFVPATVGLFWKKHAHAEACWLSMLAGLCVWAGYIVIRTGAFNISDATMETYYIAALYGFLASIAAYILGTVFRLPIRHLIKLFYS